METTNTEFTVLLTGEEIARILNVSRAYAYQLMRQQQIRTVKIGCSFRARPEDLATFIKDNSSQVAL
ncbi:MAG: helix-turn-helix domain-containing protein [Anaerolineaceae bacterium]|nr:helix-turn-helix domain-containing protein [Anaerolineaceae bacterium]